MEWGKISKKIFLKEKEGYGERKEENQVEGETGKGKEKKANYHLEILTNQIF